MRYSGYQLETVLHQMARLVRERLAAAAADPVTLSEEGRARAPTVTLISEEDIPAADGAARGIYEPARHPEPVERELERRAGSFMTPPVEPAAPAKPIPKARPRPRRKR
jgi:hypothetical protein